MILDFIDKKSIYRAVLEGLPQSPRPGQMGESRAHGSSEHSLGRQKLGLICQFSSV